MISRRLLAFPSLRKLRCKSIGLVNGPDDDPGEVTLHCFECQGYRWSSEIVAKLDRAKLGRSLEFVTGDSGGYVVAHSLALHINAIREHTCLLVLRPDTPEGDCMPNIGAHSTWWSGSFL